jgi:uncharacterized membrane protein
VRQIRAALRAALWPIPTLAVLAAIVLGVALPALDRLLESRGDSPFTWAFGGGPAAARDVLAAIAGSLISVTGLTFSLTVVALQLAGSQYSPRVLQTFVSDRTVQLTLAQLTATFVFALTVLRTVRTESATAGGDPAFVPRVSVTVAFLLTLGSVVSLLLFLGHLAQQLRVETMLRDVHTEGQRTIDTELAETTEDRNAELPAGPGLPVTASSSGFLVDVDEKRLVAAATEAGAVLLFSARIGDSVVEGVPLVHVWPARRGDQVDLDRVRAGLADAVRLHFERLPERDVAYGLRKVVDIAVRALSPGVNDPTTAVHALSHASALLGVLLERPVRSCPHRDADGTLRLVTVPWTHADLLRLALEEPLQYAAGSPAVLRRLAGLLREAAWRAPRGTLDGELRDQLHQVLRAARDSTRVTDEERRAWEERFEQAMAGRWPEARPGPAAGG